MTYTPPRELICPKCKNSACLVYPEIFAKRHLPEYEKELYSIITRAFDAWFSYRMSLYRESIEKGEA